MAVSSDHATVLQCRRQNDSLSQEQIININEKVNFQVGPFASLQEAAPSAACCPAHGWRDFTALGMQQVQQPLNGGFFFSALVPPVWSRGF